MSRSAIATSGATSGPSARLLRAFCALAADWLAADKAFLKLHGGRFDAAELERIEMKAPAVHAGCLAVASAREDYGAVLFDFRLAAAVLSRRTAKGEAAGAQARRLADRLCFELAGAQAWPQACFEPEELDPARADGSRHNDIGDPRDIRAANLYSGKLDGKGFALWAVTWTQRFLARPSDFDIAVPLPAGIPHTVLSGRDPDIGRGHEGDYETVVAPEAPA